MSAPAFKLRQGFKGRGMGLPAHSHDDAQLTFAVSGTVQVHAGQGRWLVPPQLAVWIPAGVMHRLDVLTDAELWMVHWDPKTAREWAPPAPLDRAFTLQVTPLMQALLKAAFATSTSADKADLVARLILHELVEAVPAPTFLPMPTSMIGQRIADLALADTKSQLAVEELASRAATSVRSVSRLFPAETGLTFKAWRQRARIVQSMDRLGRGQSISQVSSELGFASTASFSAAFRQVTDMTPTAFLDCPS